MSYIRVLLPLSLDWIPTFSTSEKVGIGQFVSVFFNRKKYLGIVWEIDFQPDIPVSKIKPILSIEKDIPLVSNEEISLWNFISSYYLCPVSEVFRIAYPSFRSKGDNIVANRIEYLRSKIEELDKQIINRQADSSKRLKSTVTEKLIAEKAEFETKLRKALDNRPKSKREIPKQKPSLVIGNFDSRLEFYINEINHALDSEAQILFLCPDLSFASRLEALLKPKFEEFLYIANYKTSNSKRFQIATRLRNGEATLVLGTKNAIFLPYTNLQLVIIDEEQDSGYKNNESSPRFNARDCAVFLGQIHCSKVLLCSSCPSLESYNNTKENKYNFVQLIDNQINSDYSVVDIIDQRKKNAMVGAFSALLIQAIDSTSGPIVLIRTWEKIEELNAFIQQRFPNKNIKILSLTELKRSLWLKPELIAVLQADGLLSKDDFRADEKALQTAAILKGFAPKVIIQTSVISRFDFSRDLDFLLQERKLFNFPPFSRMVDLCNRIDSSVIEHKLFARNSSLAAEKKDFENKFHSPSTYFDVDPL